MKTYVVLILIILCLSSCDSETVICESGQGDKVHRIETEVRFDQRFDQLVLWRHVSGTIDSFETFIPCNLPDGCKVGSIVLFDGIVTELPRGNEPSTLVAGEEFFGVRLITIDKEPR